MSAVQREIKGKVVFFQIDNTKAVSYLWKEGGNYCREVNGLARKILLSCHKDVVTVYPEYLCGVANLK